jgi:regulatory protein
VRARRFAGAEHERSTDRDACREAALGLLERTRRTRADLERRLRDKGYAATTIAETLERLSAVGLVDDVEYARAWLAGRRLRRPAGARRLALELRAKGVAPEAIAAAAERLDEQQGAVDAIATARRAVAGAERRLAALEPRERKRRLWALLARRGFDADTIQQALRPEQDA